jgi:hypothetical protein
MSDNLTRMLDEEAPLGAEADSGPVYRVDSNTKVLVSKHYGSLWKGRISSARRARQIFEDGWDEATRYYNHNQWEYRQRGDNRSGNRYLSARRNSQWAETENIVYANIRAIMPAVYAKNPTVEMTCTDEEYKDYVHIMEDLLNTLAGSDVAPGINLKVHAKQAVLAAELHNLAWLRYGYTERNSSIEEAQAELATLTAELEKAEDAKTIREIEGKIMALEETLNVLQPAGPFVCFEPAHNVLVDPDARSPDFSDATWMALRCVYPTAYLNAKYGKKGEDGQVQSLYKPTHVLTASSGSTDDDNFLEVGKDVEAHQYGYSDTQQLAKAFRTECWMIWDKVTRRVFLYANNDWTWPIWVEQDPYGLPNFFPMRPLVYNTTPMSAMARSPVTYYLDQQDAINEINDEYRRARQDVKENILYDDSMDRESVEKWLTGSNNLAQGVKIPEGKTLRDMILEKPNTLLKVLPLFDKGPLFAAIDRLSGVSDVLRNAQFKTNTTNKAIENYNSVTAMRLDEKIDAIEDFFGKVFYDLAFLVGQFMTPNDVENVLGADKAAKWRQYPPSELRRILRCRVVGGSTQKPTSEAKKQQALQLADILSKFVEMAPSVVIGVIMDLFDEAFDELHLPPDAFQRIKEEATMALQRGNNAPPSGTTTSTDVAAQIDALPEEARQALGLALSRGASLREALPMILQAQQGNPGGLQ